MSRQPGRDAGPFWDLRPHDRKVYSQYGEDGAIERLLSLLPVTSRFAVEIGVWFGPGDGVGGEECNTRALRERPEWTVVQIDGSVPDGHPFIHQEFVTAENVNEILERYGVPPRFALLSLDVDGVDYWLWKAIAPRFRPHLVVIEYNAMFADADVAKVVPYDPEYRWDGTSWTGASLGALVLLARQRGYALVHCTEPNAFFVPVEDLGGCSVPSPQEVYSRRWGYLASPVRDPQRRPWVDVGSRRHLGRKLQFWLRRLRHLRRRPPRYA
jgi:hypothetical protein